MGSPSQDVPHTRVCSLMVLVSQALFFLQYVTENFEQKGFPIPHCVLKDALLNLLVKMRLDFIFL